MKPGMPPASRIDHPNGISTMKFMMIAYAHSGSEAGQPPDPRLMAGIGELTEELIGSGAFVDMGGLAPTAMGARAKLSGGKVTITDGPFAEAKEIVGGYVIVDVPSLDDAKEMCRKFWQLHADILGPSYEGGGEIRRLFSSEDFAPQA